MMVQWACTVMVQDLVECADPCCVGLWSVGICVVVLQDEVLSAVTAARAASCPVNLSSVSRTRAVSSAFQMVGIAQKQL